MARRRSSGRGDTTHSSSPAVGTPATTTRAIGIVSGLPMKQRVAPNLHDSHSNDAYNAGDDAIMPHAMRRPDQHRHIEEERADEEGNGDHEPDEHDDDRCSAHICLHQPRLVVQCTAYCSLRRSTDSAVGT